MTVEGKHALEAIAVLWLLGGAAVADARPGPRPLAEAERHAVALAVSYLEHGADGWWDELSAQSPLRPLGREAAIAELAVRAGPAAGAVWTLQTAHPANRAPPGVSLAIFAVEFPSGLDETLIFELVEESGWKLQRLRCLGEEAPGPMPRLAALGPLRLVLAGTRQQDPEGLFAAPPEASAARIAELWEAGYWLRELELDRVEKILGPEPSSQLGALIAARLAMIRDQWEVAEAAYSRSARAGWDYDGLRLERTAGLARYLGFRALKAHFEDLAGQGSRHAEVYYVLAGMASISGERTAAERYLQAAWVWRPIERRELFENPALAHLAVQPRLFDFLGLGSVAEPRVSPPGPRQPLRFPSSARAFLSGNHLSLKIGDGNLVVPGGGALAPTGLRPVDAGAEARRAETEALKRLPVLSRSAATDILALPLRHRQVEAAANTLARRQRWNELLELTRGLATNVEHAGPALGSLRAQALAAVGRDREASELLVALAESTFTKGSRHDPGALYLLAEFCARHRRYDLAIRLLEKASAASEVIDFTARIRQLELDRQLEKSYRQFQSRHFDIRFPESTAEKYAVLVSALLEAERQRLMKWIPVQSDRRVEVHLFPFEDFMAAYSHGVEVAGIFDGRIRLPFADFQNLHPVLGTVMTHELAHAMITEYTSDRAPKWFHEGLAQHVEPIQDGANPKLAWANLLAFPLIDQVLTGFSDPLFVSMSYNEALWSLHFIEAKHGLPAVHGLLDAFARGRSTAQALNEVLGLSVAEFDRALWDWCSKEAPREWKVEEPDYSEKMMAAVMEAVPEFAAEIERNKMPKVGLKRFAGKTVKQQLSEVHLEQVREWHGYYTQVVQPAKQHLGEMLKARAGQASVGLGVACRSLRTALFGILADPRVFDSPDHKVNQALRSGYDHLQQMTNACRPGSTTDFEGELKAAERYLGIAAELMKPYKLYP